VLQWRLRWNLLKDGTHIFYENMKFILLSVLMWESVYDDQGDPASPHTDLEVISTGNIASTYTAIILLLLNACLWFIVRIWMPWCANGCLQGFYNVRVDRTAERGISGSYRRGGPFSFFEQRRMFRLISHVPAFMKAMEPEEQAMITPSIDPSITPTIAPSISAQSPLSQCSVPPCRRR